MNIHQVGVRVQDAHGNLGVIMDGGCATDADYLVRMDDGQTWEAVHSQVTPVAGDPSRLVQFLPADEYGTEEWWCLFFYQQWRDEELCEGCGGKGGCYASMAYIDAECTEEYPTLTSQESLPYCKECILGMVLECHHEGPDWAPGTRFYTR